MYLIANNHGQCSRMSLQCHHCVNCAKFEIDEKLRKELPDPEVKKPVNPVSVLIMNAIRGLPTNEDLCKACFVRVNELGIKLEQATLLNF